MVVKFVQVLFSFCIFFASFFALEYSMNYDQELINNNK